MRRVKLVVLGWLFAEHAALSMARGSGTD